VSLKVQTSRHLDVTVMEFAGRVSLGEGASLYWNAVRDAIWNGQKKLALDYGDITYLDSTGTGEMFHAFTLVSNAGGQLVLFDLTRRVKDLLLMTKLYTCFEVFDTLEAVLSYFDSTRTAEVAVSERRYADVSVLEVAGAVTASTGAAKIREAAINSLRAGTRSIVVLCPQITDIDDSGAKCLSDASDGVHMAGGKLLLTGVEDRLLPRLSTVAAGSLPQNAETLDAALKAFGLSVDHSGRQIKVARAS
jgi:anti-sigma B factor antagonist